MTACTRERLPILSNTELHGILLSSWKEAMAWQVGRYVIMPDHIHLFCQASDLSVSLETWMRYWKGLVRKRWSGSHQGPMWQSRHWDTRMRSQEQYASKWAYVRENPVRAGLVEAPEEWPFAGELTKLEF